MFLQSSYTTEYLSETNLVLTQEDHGNKLTDLLQPIKLFLQDDQDLLSFSLARYCGGDTRIAFFAQWLMMTTALTLDNSELQLKTREYLLKKNAFNLDSSESYGHKINELADSVFVPMQLNVMQAKSHSLASDIVYKTPQLHKYLSRSYYGKVLAHELRSRSFWIHDDLSIAEYQSMQGFRESYLYVSYPALIALVFNFHQEESMINPQAIKWVILEEVFETIAALHQTGRGFELERMLYYETLTAEDKLIWISLPLHEQKRLLFENEEVQVQGKEFRFSLHRKGTQTLDSLILPDKYMNMIKDLLDWALASNFVEA